MQPLEQKIGENDDTAELPVLDVAAYEQSLEDDRNEHTDTWVSPHPIALDPPPDLPASAVPTLRPVPAEVDLGALSATLHAVEDRLRQKSDRLLSLEREIADVRQDRAKSLAESDERVRTLEQRVAELDELRSIADTQHEAALIRANTDIALSREQLESRTQTFQARIAQLEHELEQMTSAHEAAARRIRELDAELSARASEFETSLTGSAADHANKLTALMAEHEAKLAALAADHEAKASARAAEYESLTSARATEFAEHLAARVQEFEAQRAARDAEWQGKLAERDNDVQAAEESLRRLEGELRAKSAKIEELSKESSGQRETIAEAQKAITERDARIQKLESDVVSTQAAFGKLQQSIERLDPVGATGEEVALEGPQRLLIRTDGNTDYVHVLNRRTRIGRGPENDLVIEAQFISRNHAILLAGPVHSTIEDLNSTNGVFVNNKRVTRQTLKDGDRVTIGRTQFRYSVRTLPERD
jgi:hypothetical protein